MQDGRIVYWDAVSDRANLYYIYLKCNLMALCNA